MKKATYIFSFLLVLVIAYACTDANGEGGTDEDGFDRKTLTTSWVNHLLIPAITDFQIKVNTLHATAISLTDVPSSSSLEKARASLFAAAKVWQHVEMFFYGTSFANDINTYPIDLDRIADNIETPVADINFNRTLLDGTQGLQTLDYLLNGLGNKDEAILTKYQDVKYANYLKALTSRMKTLTTTIISDFQTVKDANINSIDNTISSYFSIQINDYVQYTEKSFREAKIAIPSGTRNRDKFPNISVDPSPQATESLFSPENSKTLYLEAYDAIQDFYYGRDYTTGTNTTGLQDYLQFLGATIMVGTNDISLDSYIETLFETVSAANSNLGDNFFEQTQTYNSNFDAAFDAIQEFVVAIKGNAISAFNLTIDFADNDGD